MRSHDSMIISHRESGANYSCFVNINDILKSNDIDKVYSAYKGVLLNINSFDSSKIDKMEDVEKKLHDRLNVLFSENRNKKNFSITNILKFVFSLGVFAYIKNKRDTHIKYLSTSVDTMHQSFTHHIALVRQSSLPKQKLAQNGLKELNNKKLTNTQEELVRLKQNPRIAKSLQQAEASMAYYGELFRRDRGTSLKVFSDPHKVAFAQSLELRETLKNGYLVINHGQNIEMMILNIVATKLKHVFEPKQYTNFQVLRHDVHLQHVQNTQDVNWFHDKLSNACAMNTNDANFARELICGDLYLESAVPTESALDFFAGEINIALKENPKLVSEILTKILINYFPDQQTRDALASEIVAMIRELGVGGTLYSICIPKEEFGTMAYLSRPFGRPAQGQYSLADLECLQDGIHPQDCPELPYEGSKNHKSVPQVRVLAHKLDASKGVLIVPHSTLSQEKMDRIQNNIELLIQKAQMQFRVQ